MVTRFPARLLIFDTTNGKTVQSLSAVGDCDDVFYDATRKRIYASGGEGAISVFEQKDPDHYKELARIITVKGARTSFFSSEVDRLFLAVRRQGSQAAEIRVFVPVQRTKRRDTEILFVKDLDLRLTSDMLSASAVV